jgi:diguanylate cyclase (GGDEF)-like protein
VAMVESLKVHLRPYDHVYRYGGDEFLIILQNINMESGKAIIERMRTSISTCASPMPELNNISIAASFGIALLDSDISTEESINRADTALYEAKNYGRDRVCIWDPSMMLKQDGL